MISGVEAVAVLSVEEVPAVDEAEVEVGSELEAPDVEPVFEVEVAGAAAALLAAPKFRTISATTFPGCVPCGDC